MNLYEATLLRLRIKEAQTREELETVIKNAVDESSEFPESSIDYAVQSIVEAEDTEFVKKIEEELAEPQDTASVDEVKKPNRRIKNG